MNKISKLVHTSLTSTLVTAGLILGFFASVTNASQISLTHRYSFNDGSATDSVGNIDGSLVNGASIADGKLVLANDGINTDPTTGQYVSLSGNILNTRNFTLETWFTFNGGNAWQRLIDLGNSVPDETYGTIGQGFIILSFNGYQPLGQVSIASWGDPADTDSVIGDTNMPIGGEHVFTYIHSTDAQTSELYLDGILIGSTIAADANPADAIYTNFYIGRSQFVQDPYYNGSFNEVRTYDGAMTGAQVLESYSAGPDIVAIPEPGSVCLAALGGYVLIQFKRKANRQDEADKDYTRSRNCLYF